MKVDDVLARYKPAERLVRILLDGSLQTQIDSVRQQIRVTKRAEDKDDPGLRTKLPALEEHLADLEHQADESSMTFKVAAIPGAEFDRLKYENPPTEEDWQRYKETQQANPSLAVLGQIRAPEFNFDGFMAKLIGRSIIEVDEETVEWGDDDGVKLWGSLHDGARSVLADAVWEVNGSKSSRPLSETATDTTTSFGSGSTTPASEGSPTPSSSDETAMDGSPKTETS